MKKITLILFSFLLITVGFSQTTIKEYTFDDAGSISGWTPVADATNGAEASISYNASGNGTGALQLTGVNSDGVGGRAYIFELRDFSINYGSATSIDVSFDIKYDTGASLFATALQLQNQVPQVGGGVLTINNSNLEGQGINETNWTNLSYTIVNEDPNFDNTVSEFYIHFNLAAGAVLNAGGTILVDNIKVISPATPTCTDGIQNGDEEGVDCGGSCPTACPTCTDGIQNGDETGVDCGGSCPASCGATVKEYTFDDAGSISGWTPVADATNGAEASISYNASGNGTGALQLTGVNSDGVGGRAYIFELRDFSINYGSATSIDVSFDIKYDTGASLFATALQLQNQVPQVGGGVLTINNSNLEGQGINETNWTNLSYTIVNEDPNFDNTVSEFYIHFNLAAGAVLNAGGTILVDNITVTNTSALDAEEFDIMDFNVYPNPTTNIWNIKAQQTIQSVDVYDVLGKQVMNLQPNSLDVSIDATTLPKGLYFARMSTELSSNSIKLIKN